MRTHFPLPDGTVDLLGAVVEREGATQPLSPLEVAALSVLAEAAPEAVSEEELLQRAWGYRATNTRTVSMAMSRLRKKLESDPRTPEVLLTVRGFGYRLALDPGVATRASSRASGLPGRDAERARAEAVLARDRVVELVGPGGIGKSALARALAPDGIWVDLADVEDDVGLWRRLVGALDASGGDARAGVRRLWAAHRGRIALDGAEGLDERARADLAALVRTGGEVVVTTREPLGLGPAVLIEPLAEDVAVALVQEVRREMGLGPVEPAQLAPALERFGGHPLALKLAAPVLDLSPTTDALLDLTEAGRSATLGTILDQSLAGLTADQRALLAAAATFAVPPDLDALCAVLGRATAAVLHDLHVVRTRALLTVERGRVVVHGFLRETASTPDARDAHIAWVAGLSTGTLVVRRYGHEIQAALERAQGPALLEVLLRHVVMLDGQGPRDALVRDVELALPRAPQDPRGLAARGMALASENEHAAAERALLEALAALPDDGSLWRAWVAYVLWGVALVTGDREVRSLAEAEMERQRQRVDDLDMRASLALRLAWVSDPPRAAALRREVVQLGDRLPDLVTSARVHDGWARRAPLAEAAAIERAVESMGPGAFSIAEWSTMWGFLAKLRCVNGDPQTAIAHLERLPERLWLVDPDTAWALSFVLAVYLWPWPDLSRRAAAKLPAGHWFAAAAAWGLDPVGPPPAEGERAAQLVAWRDGAPIPGPAGQLREALAFVPRPTVRVSR